MVTFEAKRGKDGEERKMATGKIKGIEPTVTVIYTMRNNGATARLISALPAKDKERMAYDNKMQIE